MRSLTVSAEKALKNPEDYEARSNIMWCATIGLNTITGLSKKQDWEVHYIEHQIGAYTDCAHGAGLAAISVAYYNYIYKYGLDKFVRFARNVWYVDTTAFTKEQAAEMGIIKLKEFISLLGLDVPLTELGVTEDMIRPIAESSIHAGGYKVMQAEDIETILTNSL